MERKRLFNTRIDENVIITMLAVSVVSFIILAFKIKNAEPPISFEIRPSKVQAYTGDLIRFETNAHGFKSLQWDFGDNKKGESGKTSTEHVYDQEGDYTVSLIVNDKRMEPVVITISQPPKIIDPVLAPVFDCPKTVEVGKLLVFRDSTKGPVSQRTWSFGESGDIDDTSQVASYTYSTPGSYNVSLMINHDINRITTRNIIVTPIPQKTQATNNANKKPARGIIPANPEHESISDQIDPPKEPTPVQIVGVEINNEDLAKELRGVADHQPLYAIGYFYKYTCNIPNIGVNLNGTTTTFDDLYNRLAKLESADKIKELRVVNMFKDKNKCISMLTIKCYIKRDLIGRKPL